MARKCKSVVVTPLQARSRKTLERILEATERLLESRRFDELGVEQICRQAGVSIGSFYARFPAKENLLQALRERYRDDLREFLDTEMIEQAAGTPLRDRVNRLVDRQIERTRRRRGLRRALALLMREKPDAAEESDHRAIAQAHQRLERYFEGCMDEIRHAEPKVAIRIGMLAISAVCREKLLFPDTPHAASIAISDARLQRELARIYLAYLVQPAAKGEPSR